MYRAFYESGGKVLQISEQTFLQYLKYQVNRTALKQQPLLTGENCVLMCAKGRAKTLCKFQGKKGSIVRERQNVALIIVLLVWGHGVTSAQRQKCNVRHLQS